MRIKQFLIFFMLMCLLKPLYLLAQNGSENDHDSIKIARLHSLSGAMTFNGQSLVNAAKMTVSEINTQGGLLGKPVEILVIDIQPNEPLFALETTQLINNEKNSALFGCWG